MEREPYQHSGNISGVGALISVILSSATKLLPEIKNSFFTASSSSSSQPPDARVAEDDLNKLITMMKKIKETLYDAEKDFRDRSVQLWLKELKEMSHAAQSVIDEYMYEVYRAKVEATNASELNARKRKQEEESGGIATNVQSIRVPEGFLDRIREITSRFYEIEKHREDLCLYEEDGPRRDEQEKSRALYSHSLLEPNVYGREKDKKRVIDLLFSNLNKGIITYVAIVGKGGLGKTTLAQLIYGDKRVKQKFDLFGWIYVSEDFNVERLTRDLIESLTKNSCSLNNRFTLQKELKEALVDKRVLIVLDDVWNDNMFLWKLFRAPFMSAASVAFIVTTRSEQVAKIMQTSSPFLLDCLSYEESWSLFHHYAFGGIDHNVGSILLDLGRKITTKCGGLPLALKSISNLLRCENEEYWIEILEDNLWEINAQDKIFGPYK